jgi:hypothetical protein
MAVSMAGARDLQWADLMAVWKAGAKADVLAAGKAGMMAA